MFQNTPKAWSNGQWIWLDLEANRYRGGVIRRDKILQSKQAEAAARLCSALYDEHTSVPPWSSVRQYITSAWMARSFRGLPITSQLEELKRQRFSPDVRYNLTIPQLTWFYQVLRNFHPNKPLCLEDSICCALFLSKFTQNFSLCIGVKQPPFSAHAWVQIGNYIINDTKPKVETYSEILRCDL